MPSIFNKIVTANRGGKSAANLSVCSAHLDVLRASLLRAQALDRAIVIEATSNQVNQFGGYSGMTPHEFVNTVNSIADVANVDRDRIFFGGARADKAGDIAPTSPDAAENALQAHHDVFSDAAWSKISGHDVQPGVEFTPTHVHHFPMDRVPDLRAVMLRWPDICLEAHSTDDQHPYVFPKLADLGFANRKLEPALTFAYLQAVYALDQMQAAGRWGQAAVRATLETLMFAEADASKGHYHEAPDQLKIARHFGLADRIRCYWAQSAAKSAVANLLSTLNGRALPLPLLWQFFDNAVIERSDGVGGITSQTLIAAQIQIALDSYFFKTNAQGAVP